MIEPRANLHLRKRRDLPNCPLLYCVPGHYRCSVTSIVTDLRHMCAVALTDRCQTCVALNQRLDLPGKPSPPSPPEIDKDDI